MIFIFGLRRKKKVFVKWQLLQATTSVFQLTKCWRSFASIIHRSTNAAQFVWPLDEAKDCTYELFIQTLRCTAVSIAENILQKLVFIEEIFTPARTLIIFCSSCASNYASSCCKIYNNIIEVENSLRLISVQFHRSKYDPNQQFTS